ncbi:MAG: sn-glycerol-3-phosphate ABC transporter ATP-binding protein UgpC [Clostridiales bacterium]|nr:sn-glycerol-3-phosphate ABC transporter ATP-binding protein UgpC [Clostridiales bacterium]
MAHLSLRNISKTYAGGVVAVKDFDLEIADRDFIVLVGPSGCGKTTTLRMIAGLEEITSGELLLNGVRINERLPKDRDMAMVFQNYALYPHMSVYDNIAFGLKVRKTPKKEILRRVNEAAVMLAIDDLLKRKPRAISGGERQRVAFARAIVRKPQVFLLDEPLSNLDAALRDQIRTELIALHKRLEATFVYVTHDQTEAMTLGTRIVIMRDGLVQQVDTPANLYNKPHNIFVAGFIGSPKMNLLKALVEKKGSQAYLRWGRQLISLEQDKSAALLQNGYEGQEVAFGIRPEHIEIQTSNSVEKPPGFSALKEIVELRGADSLIHLTCDGNRFTVRLESDAAGAIGQYCQISFVPDKLHIFDAGNGESI